MKSVTRYLLATTAVAGILGSVAVSRATLEAATATATLTIQASVSQQCTVPAVRPCEATRRRRA